MLREKFQAVRGELLEIETELLAPTDVPAPRGDITPAVLEHVLLRQMRQALALSRLCRILVRVIDKLP